MNEELNQSTLIPFPKKDLYIWLIDQDHVPFDMSSDAHGTHYHLFQEFLKDINKLYQETHHIYFYYHRGILKSTNEPTIPINYVKVNIEELRNIKLKQLLE